MELQFFCPLWGSEQLPFEIFLQNVKEAGYNGVEMGFSLHKKERDVRAKLIKQFGLKLIGQHWETIEPDFQKHSLEYEKRLKNLAATFPLFINSQTGKDYYSFEQNKKLFDVADRVSGDTGVEIIHETHRGKWSFAAHITKEFLEKLPLLKIAFDVSHWCNTAETFLEDQPEALALAIKATKHIHARVGYAEGPQVPDPRIPLWKKAFDAHAAWWDAIIELRKDEIHTTITPEFGAPPYMVLHPATAEPLVNQWDVNVWMMNYFKNRYK